MASSGGSVKDALVHKQYDVVCLYWAILEECSQKNSNEINISLRSWSSTFGCNVRGFKTILNKLPIYFENISVHQLDDKNQSSTNVSPKFGHSLANVSPLIWRIKVDNYAKLQGSKPYEDKEEEKDNYKKNDAMLKKEGMRVAGRIFKALKHYKLHDQKAAYEWLEGYGPEVIERMGGWKKLWDAFHQPKTNIQIMTYQLRDQFMIIKGESNE